MTKHYTLPLLAAFALCNAAAYAQPENDECGAAMLVSASATCMPMEQDAAEATQSFAPIYCGGWHAGQANDLWYHFMGTGSPVTLQATGLGDVDLVMELFSGPCADLDSVDCADATYADGGTEEIVATTTLGVDYLFRVYPYLTSHSDFEYTVCAVGAGTAGISERGGLAMRLMPNPSNGDMTVAIGAPNAHVQVDVTDVAGRLAHSAQVIADGNGRIDLHLAGTLVPGSYVLRTSTTSGSAVRNFVVN